MLRQRKIPMRQCKGCREMFPKKELLRVVRSPQGEISFDSVGKKPGRGAYICRKAECFQKARKSRSLERELECAITEEVYDQLLSQLEGGSV